jgi:predicted phosphoribosyltransferase
MGANPFPGGIGDRVVRRDGTFSIRGGVSTGNAHAPQNAAFLRSERRMALAIVVSNRVEFGDIADYSDRIVQLPACRKDNRIAQQRKDNTLMFKNRTDAGQQLADVLHDHDIEADIVLAIPRGGLPVGRVVADSLGVPLDIVSARKLGAPGNPELAIGAVASDATVWLNQSMIRDLGVEDAYIHEQIEHEREAALAKIERYRGDRPPLELRGKTVLVIDDGVATGATTIACIRQIKNADAERVILAVPVAPPNTVERLYAEADEVISVVTPSYFGAVGQFYESFDQVSDEQAKAYLETDEE